METIRARFLQFSGVVVTVMTAAAIKYNSAIPSFLYPLCFAVLGLAYTNLLWRIVTPKHDLNGDWWGHTDYKVLERQAQDELPDLPNRKPHFIRFRQNPFALSIEASEGKDMVSWRAESVTLYPEGRIVMAYTVRRTASDKGFPPDTKGYEEMHVVERNWFGKPKRLRGVFFHAAEPGKNLFSGETEYVRGKAPECIRKRIARP